GNRAMIKPSEYTPATSSLMQTMIAEVFDTTEVAVVTGGPEVGMAFSNLPFDHMIFTGATSVGKHIMAAAAKNLVPVTLELGGKSPALVGRSANYAQAASSIMLGNGMNSGQVCLKPDYVLVPEEQRDSFVELLKAKASEMYPSILANQDYTSIVNQRHYQRLQGYIDDARAKGATIIEINPANEDFSQQAHHKIPPTLVLNPSDDMLVMQEEIFGPLLPERTYSDYKDAIAYVNSKPRPLGLYYFGRDAAEETFTLSRTTSGGVTINDVIMHITQEDLPFGGVGPSGMGAYHGFDGFKTFSHAKAVYRQSRLDVAGLGGLKPPYGKKTVNAIKMQLK
ncbi:MAG: aldehyde dehydrogenase family protein, partial [Gammaproteobacteria bacterium]|nr:aldehyde dehydrogenase family protein [Gammaproteobacteria bacterium]